MEIQRDWVLLYAENAWPAVWKELQEFVFSLNFCWFAQPIRLPRKSWILSSQWLQWSLMTRFYHISWPIFVLKIEFLRRNIFKDFMERWKQKYGRGITLSSPILFPRTFPVAFILTSHRSYIDWNLKFVHRVHLLPGHFFRYLSRITPCFFIDAGSKKARIVIPCNLFQALASRWSTFRPPWTQGSRSYWRPAFSERGWATSNIPDFTPNFAANRVLGTSEGIARSIELASVIYVSNDRSILRYQLSPTNLSRTWFKKIP